MNDLLAVPIKELFVICFPILCVLLAMEYCWRKKILKVETTRKIIHLFTGTLIAFLPFFVTYRVLQYLAVCFLIIILASYKLRIFMAVHSVKRVTIGEILYPIGIGICAFLEPATWMFTAAILHLALADSAAALAGHRWGKKTRYYIVTHGKSLVGSFAFLATSFAIFAAASLLVMASSLPGLAWLLVFSPVALTLLENLSLFGSDDITIPVAVIVLMSGLPS